jgi:hypothetical protein
VRRWNQFRRLSRARRRFLSTGVTNVCSGGLQLRDKSRRLVTSVGEIARFPGFSAANGKLAVLRTGLTSDTSPQPGLLKSNHGSYLGTPSNYSDLLLFADLTVAAGSYIGTY